MDIAYHIIISYKSFTKKVYLLADEDSCVKEETSLSLTVYILQVIFIGPRIQLHTTDKYTPGLKDWVYTRWLVLSYITNTIK